MFTYCALVERVPSVPGVPMRCSDVCSWPLEFEQGEEVVGHAAKGSEGRGGPGRKIEVFRNVLIVGRDNLQGAILRLDCS